MTITVNDYSLKVSKIIFKKIFYYLKKEQKNVRITFSTYEELSYR